jgi:exosortase H (IPTLxxWG-CTERM-specific)
MTQSAVPDRRQARRTAARFLGTFAVLAGVFYIVALWPPFERMFYIYLAANARIVNALLRMFAQDTHVSGLTVLSPQFAISIRRGCDGLEPAWIFCSAVIAFPASARSKLAVLPLGVGLILIVNVARILSLYFIGLKMPAFFPVAHLELWPATFMILVIAIWLCWVRSPGRADLQPR